MPPIRPALAAALLLLPLLAGSVAAQTPSFSRLERNADVLGGTIETIDPAAHRMVLRTADGARRLIYYDTATVVIEEHGGTAPAVRPGQDVLVRCRRQITPSRAPHTGVCPMRLFADRVYLASN